MNISLVLALNLRWHRKVYTELQRNLQSFVYIYLLYCKLVLSMFGLNLLKIMEFSISYEKWCNLELTLTVPRVEGLL